MLFPMPFQTYILRSKSSGRFYVGSTQNLNKRILEHNNNRTPSIKNRGPWDLFYCETYTTRSEAVRRERQIKSMKSRAYIQSLAGASRSDREGR